MNIKDIKKQVQSEINQKRINAIKLVEKNLEDFFKIKNAKSVFEDYQNLKIEYSKNAYLKNFKECETLKQKLHELKNQMNKIIKENNVDVKNLKPQFSCSNCLDTGEINGSKCLCYKNILSEKLLELSGLNKETLPTFSSLNYDFVTQENQKKDLIKISKLLIDFCNKFDETKINLVLLSGCVGVGKTYLMECVINELINAGKYVLYETAFSLNKKLLEAHCSLVENKNELLDPFIECDLLCIDDLGTENLTKNVTVEYLYSILNERIMLNKKTIITSNLSLSQINDRYEERIASRIMDKNSLKLEIKGNDLRLNKK